MIKKARKVTERYLKTKKLIPSCTFSFISLSGMLCVGFDSLATVKQNVTQVTLINVFFYPYIVAVVVIDLKSAKQKALKLCSIRKHKVY